MNLQSFAFVCNYFTLLLIVLSEPGSAVPYSTAEKDLIKTEFGNTVTIKRSIQVKIKQKYYPEV